MNTNSGDFNKPDLEKSLDKYGKPAADGFDKSGWIAQARRLLDESAEGLDAATLSRLNRARQAAIAPRLRRMPRPWLLPTGLAGACAMLLVVAIWTPHHTAPVAGDAGRVGVWRQRCGRSDRHAGRRRFPRVLPGSRFLRVARRAGQGRLGLKRDSTPTRIVRRLLFATASVVAPGLHAAQPAEPTPPPAPVQAAPASTPWQSLSSEQQQILAPVRDLWPDLPADVQQHLRQAAQRWPKLGPAQREQLTQRMQKWASMSPEQRERLHRRYEQFQQLPPEQQAQLRDAFKRFDALPEIERSQLRERFERMSPAERGAFLEGAGAQNRAAAVKELMQALPKDDRRATREMLEGLTPAQRMAFIHAWRGTPAEQRDDYRRQILLMTPTERAAALAR